MEKEGTRMITDESYCCNCDSTIAVYYFEPLKAIATLYNLTPLTVLSPWVWDAFPPFVSSSTSLSFPHGAQETD